VPGLLCDGRAGHDPLDRADLLPGGDGAWLRPHLVRRHHRGGGANRPLIAPPIGLNVFVIGGMARDVLLATIYRGILPFLAMQIVLLGLLTLWPRMALLLPNTMR
jgi:Tripartite ATP-independent periplasmic transporter, DctM component